MLYSGKTLRVISVLLAISLVFFAVGCFGGNGDEPENDNDLVNQPPTSDPDEGEEVIEDDPEDNGGESDDISGDLLDLWELENIARLNVYKGTIEEQFDGDKTVVDFELSHVGEEEIDGVKFNKMVTTAVIEGEEQQLTLWIADDGTVAKVDFGGYTEEGSNAQDWAEYDFREEMFVVYSFAREFSVDILGTEQLGGEGWVQKTSTSSTESLGGSDVEVVSYEVQYMPPLVEAPVFATWKIADFGDFRVVVGFSTKDMEFTLEELSFRN